MMAYTPRSSSGAAPYAVGNKIYGGGRSFPTMGPVDKLEANSNAKYASADSLRKV
jgi:hypothetical protein